MRLQLLAACERDGEADRALEAFARMMREAPGCQACPLPPDDAAGDINDTDADTFPQSP